MCVPYLQLLQTDSCQRRRVPIDDLVNQRAGRRAPPFLLHLLIRRKGKDSAYVFSLDGGGRQLDEGGKKDKKKEEKTLGCI